MTPQESIAHYRIVSKLGEGGMGAVYRATDTKLNRDVAIKVLPDTFAQDPDRMARFAREAQVLASLNHPNIAAIHGVEERAIVMELVEGETLSGPRSVEEALPIIHQLIDALEYAHEKGIVHRDLKPANIKVTPEGRVKVLDFGLAKAMSEESSTAGSPASSPTLTMRATMAGTIMGTAAYMSPEQARGQSVDKRADIWAFGVVVHEILTGRRLFEGPSISDTLAAVLKETPDWNAVPARLRKLLRLCLEKDPRRRLRDIGDARALIEEESPAAPIAAPSSKIPWAIAAALALALASAGILLWKTTRLVDRPLVRVSVDLGPDAVTDAERSAVLSPDGSRLAYLVRTGGSAPRIAVRLLDQRQATILPGTENATGLLFSPDGEWIAFFSFNQLKKVRASGGAVTTICDAPIPRGGFWDEDNRIVFSANRRVLRVSANGGKTEALGPDESKLGNQRSPQILPGGEALLFTAGSASTYVNAGIHVLSLKTGQIKEVARGYYGRYLPSGHLLYIREGVLVAQRFDLAALQTQGPPVTLFDDVAANSATGMGQFAFSNSGTMVYLSGAAVTPGWQFAWTDRTGKPELLPIPVAINSSPRLSPDGRRLVLAVGSPDVADLHLYDFERLNLSRFTLDRKGHYHSAWAPGGRHVAYVSLEGVNYSLWWARADGAGEAQRLMDAPDRIVPTAFSPDGRRLAFHQASPGTGLDLWTLPLDISDPEHPKAGKPEPLLRSPANEAQATFSPDGKWIAHGTTETGKIDVFVRPFRAGGVSGGRWLISDGGGDYPAWSRDGRTLFYVSPDGRLMEVPYETHEGSFVPGKPRPWSNIRIDVATFGGRQYDVSPDGKRLLVPYLPGLSEEKKDNVHVTFLFNFFDELRRKVK